MKEVQLPTGAKLSILHVPFAEAKALYVAVMGELRGVELSGQGQLMDLAKNLVCMGFASRAIDQALTKVMGRCTYNSLRIDEQTFESETTREDYTLVCMEVLEETIRPFSKNLSVVLSRLLGMVAESPPSESKKTT